MDLWKHDFGDDSLVKYIKAVTMEELTQVVSMDLLAQSREVALSEDELSAISEAAAEYYASLSKEENTYLEVTESDISEYYQHYALAQKLYNSLTNSVNEEVSDDEARVIEIMQIFVADSTKASDVAAKLERGDDFASVANNYNELSSIQTTVARDELPKEVEEVAFNLDNGQTSSMIQAGKGFYFIKCLNKYNEELTEANKSNIVEKREKRHLMMSIISLWRTEFQYQQRYVDELTLDTTDGIQTDSFFEIFENIVGKYKGKEDEI